LEQRIHVARKYFHVESMESNAYQLVLNAEALNVRTSKRDTNIDLTNFWAEDL